MDVLIADGYFSDKAEGVVVTQISSLADKTSG